MTSVKNDILCEKCGGRTYLSRREPHPTRGDHQLHTYRCASCEYLQERDSEIAAP